MDKLTRNKRKARKLMQEIKKLHEENKELIKEKYRKDKHRRVADTIKSILRKEHKSTKGWNAETVKAILADKEHRLHGRVKAIFEHTYKGEV